MFNRKDTPGFEKVDTFLSRTTSITGKLTSEGTVRIDGRYSGELSIKGDLLIGEEGKVEADVEARNVMVSGELNGNVTASGRVEIVASGKLFGDITVAHLVIDEGAVFQGNCQMNKEAGDKRKDWGENRKEPGEHRKDRGGKA